MKDALTWVSCVGRIYDIILSVTIKITQKLWIVDEKKYYICKNDKVCTLFQIEIQIEWKINSLKWVKNHVYEIQM